jgi:hypothetical protein
MNDYSFRKQIPLVASGVKHFSAYFFAQGRQTAGCHSHREPLKNLFSTGIQIYPDLAKFFIFILF